MPETHVSKDRFEFGKNWESFSHLLDENRIFNAQARLTSFLGLPDLSGRTFLDIGCGSGLHSLAALRLGAARVVAIDIDPDSVATARSVLSGLWSEPNWSIHQTSVFD